MYIALAIVPSCSLPLFLSRRGDKARWMMARYTEVALDAARHAARERKLADGAEAAEGPSGLLLALQSKKDLLRQQVM